MLKRIANTGVNLVVLGVSVAIFLVAFFALSALGAAGRPPTIEVLSATRDLNIGDVISANDLIVKKVFQDDNAALYIRGEEAAGVVGGIVAQPIFTGQPIFRTAIIAQAAEGTRLSAVLAKYPGYSLFPLPLDAMNLVAPDVEAFLREAKFPYAIGYGLTETSPLVAGTGPERTRLRSTGPALRGTTIRIQNPDPRTGEGEIMVKGPTVMKGYYRDEEKTRAVLSEDGWLSTGDLGVIDADGFIFIKGRSKNMILGPSGKNIYPEEIEAVINEFEHVRESVVYEHQKRLVALVHLDYERLQKALHSLSESDIRQKANALLADLQKEINTRVPLYARIHRIIEQAEPFQKTPTQKIKRHLYIPTALRRDH